MATWVVCMLSYASHTVWGCVGGHVPALFIYLSPPRESIFTHFQATMEQNATEASVFGLPLRRSARSFVSKEDISLNASHDAEAAQNTSTTEAYITNRNTCLRAITFLTPTGSYPMTFSRRDCDGFFCLLQTNWGQEEPHVVGLRLAGQ
eukprot:6210726-Pleurochrysis_carterae.AAC.4